MKRFKVEAATGALVLAIACMLLFTGAGEYLYGYGVRIVKIGPETGAVDAFNRIRVSNPSNIFDSKQLYDKSPLYWAEKIYDAAGGSATSTHDSTNACVDMTVAAGDTIIRQTKTHWAYLPGKSQLIYMTGVMDTSATYAGVTARIGAFNEDSGVFFEQSNGYWYAVVRKEGVDTRTPKGNWNIDKMNGSGYSRVSIDRTKSQIFVFNYEWLGVGSVWFGFVVDGEIWWAHRADHANNINGVYMATPNVPLRYEIASTSAAATMRHICTSVISEGGTDAAATCNHVIESDKTTLVASVPDTLYAALVVRLKDGRLDSNVFPTVISALPLTADAFEWKLMISPTIAGALTWQSNGSGCIQYAIGATANVIKRHSERAVVAAGFVSSTQQARAAAQQVVRQQYRLGSNIDGVQDTLVLAIQPMTADLSVRAAMQFVAIP